jgi:hypothetical protein
MTALTYRGRLQTSSRKPLQTDFTGVKGLKYGRLEYEGIRRMHNEPNIIYRMAIALLSRSYFRPHHNLDCGTLSERALKDPVQERRPVSCSRPERGQRPPHRKSTRLIAYLVNCRFLPLDSFRLLRT